MKKRLLAAAVAAMLCTATAVQAHCACGQSLAQLAGRILGGLAIEVSAGGCCRGPTLRAAARTRSAGGAGCAHRGDRFGA